MIGEKTLSRKNVKVIACQAKILKPKMELSDHLEDQSKSKTSDPENTKTFVPENTSQIATTSETENNSDVTGGLFKLVRAIYADPCSLCTKTHGGHDQHYFYFSRLSRSAHVDCIKKFEEEMPYIAALRYIVRCGCISKKLPMGTRADFEQYICRTLLGKPLEVISALNQKQKKQVDLITVVNSIEWLTLHCEMSGKNPFSLEEDDIKWLGENRQDLIDAWDKLVKKVSNLAEWSVMGPLSPYKT